MEEFSQYFDICTRPAFPELRPLKDLSTDTDMAEAIISIADDFFHLNHVYTVYSGYAREADAKDGDAPALYVQVWVEDTLRRTAAFRAVGYVGVLHIEVANELGFRQGLKKDLIGATFMHSRQRPERVLATVKHTKVEVSYEIAR